MERRPSGARRSKTCARANGWASPGQTKPMSSQEELDAASDVGWFDAAQSHQPETDQIGS